MSFRLAAIAVGLWVGTAWAQGTMDACNQKCSDKMMGCMQKCQSDMKCAGRCQNQMQSCMSGCNAAPAEVSTADAKKKCFGADGRKIPCATYKPTKPSKKQEDKGEYPNKAAKDLSSDPDFKGAATPSE